MIITALQSQPLIALISIILTNATDSHVEVMAGTLILGATPEKMAGRVFSALGTTTTISSLLAMFLSGYLSSTLLYAVDFHLFAINLDAINILNVCAGIALIGGGMYAFRALRKVHGKSVAASGSFPPDVKM